jgi:hypothetical protein
MPTVPAESILPLYLMDLHAQLEAQLRCLRLIQEVWGLRFTKTTLPDLRHHFLELIELNGVVLETCSKAVHVIEHVTPPIAPT